MSQIGHNSGSNAPQTLAWEPLDSLHILACPRVPLQNVLHLMPPKYIEAMQERPEACCREVANNEIEAWYSGPDDERKGVPDIYKFHCSCGRCHVRFCVGGNHPDAVKFNRRERPELFDIRPFWEVR